MKTIIKKLNLKIPRGMAYQKFVEELNEWWPKEYTWSQESLREIKIDGKENGLCTEIGPYGFRCDWGRVTQLVENEYIKLKWQIGPTREPVPNPKNASTVKVQFLARGPFETSVELEHSNFENHGKGADEYQEMMNGERGWDYILLNYTEYCGYFNGVK